MNQLELLTVEHTFFISKHGVQMLVLAPRLTIPKNWSERGWSERQEQVTVMRPDGTMDLRSPRLARALDKSAHNDQLLLYETHPA
jgi:hypothetical protein